MASCSKGRDWVCATSVTTQLSISNPVKFLLMFRVRAASTLAALLVLFSLGPIPPQTSQAVAIRAFDIYMDQPLVQGSYIGPDLDATTETFNSFTGSGEDCGSNGPLQVGLVEGGCSVYDSIDLGASETGTGQTLGGSGSRMATGGGSKYARFKVNFAQEKKYVGFWWSAGSTGNTVNFYSNGAIVSTINVNQVFQMFGTSPFEAAAAGDQCYGQSGSVAAAAGDKCFGNSLDINETASVVTSIAGTQYLKNLYFGNPNGYTPPSGGPSSIAPSSRVFSEPFVYIHGFALNGANFDAVEFVGKNFEIDNLTVASAEKTPRNELVSVQSVPGKYLGFFNSQGGSAVTTGTFLSGGQLAAPTPPTKSGYTFTGWVDTVTSTSLLTFPYSPGVSDDITLYAKWVISECSPTRYSGTYTDSYSVTSTLPADTYLYKFTQTSRCKWVLPDAVSSLSYVIVGGGGGGGFDAGGGGGGGAVETGTISLAASNDFYLTVGVGGLGATSNASGATGSSSTLEYNSTSRTIAGGGGGGPCNYGGFCNSNSGGTNGTTFGAGGAGVYNGSGTALAASGTVGAPTDITGRDLFFGSGGGGGGGGGGAYLAGGLGALFDVANNIFGGGRGGGNDGSAEIGLANTGGGGGGGYGGGSGRDGADGVIYIRYTVPTPTPTPTPSSSSNSQSGNAPTTEARIPGIFWEPKSMSEGETLNSDQLSAVFSVPGKIEYNLKQGFLPEIGEFKLTVTFTPENKSEYMVLSTSRIIQVLPKPKASATPIAQPSKSASPQPDPVTDTLLSLKKIGEIYFRNNEYFLDAKDRTMLKEISSEIKSKKFKTVIVQGNTDVKKGVDNYWLSKARAEAVLNYLATLAPSPLYNRVWYASKRPVAIGLDKKSLALNRRVEIYAQVKTQKEVTSSPAPSINLVKNYEPITFNRNESFLDAGDRKSLLASVRDMASFGCNHVYLKGSRDQSSSSVNSYIVTNRVGAIKKFMTSINPSLKFTIESGFISANREVRIRCSN
ncbi:unannotated protein [freshwater metagenome]|uniref:Unannotated protein n=1 Tax=freshwater metagenome TaxID=449393 RepID=A0A6J6B7U9_9ZZZZ|nr:OmpA family protein [Actinomycetota bacterium]